MAPVLQVDEPAAEFLQRKAGDFRASFGGLNRKDILIGVFYTPAMVHQGRAKLPSSTCVLVTLKRKRFFGALKRIVARSHASGARGDFN